MIDEKEINLSAIFKIIWERGKRIMIFTLVCTVISAGASLLIKNRYESIASLMMNPSKLGESIMQRPVTPMGSYLHFFTYPKHLMEIIDQYQLDEKPYKFRYPGDLKRRMFVSYVPNTSMFEIHVQLEDPQLAADVANELAERACNTVNQLMKIEQNVSTAEIEEESEKIFNEALQYKNVYLDTLKRNMKPLQIQTINNLMSMYATAMQEKETLDASILELEEKRRRFEEDVFSATSEYKQKLEVRRALVTDPLLVDQLRERKGEEINLDDLSDIVFYEETIDPYYNQLLMEYKSLLADIPSLTAKRDFLAKRTVEIQEKITQLQNELFEMDVEELVDKGNFDRAMEIFSGIDKEAGWAGTTVVSERQDLVLVDRAVPIKKKVYPRRSLIVVMAALTAFLLSFLYYLLIDLYGLMIDRSKKESEA
ncbi:MAG: Wzz/FepE/Etk N-terminal domain-containing protein [Candidatus Hinthialibacter sp.]